MKRWIYFYFLLTILFSCQQKESTVADGNLVVVTTTTIISDLVKNIGGDRIHVQGLMGAGVDPHLYKASEGDVSKLSSADLIVFGGLHLEGKLVDVFTQMERQGKHQLNLGASIEESKLHASKSFGGNYDPHVWFDINLVKIQVNEIAKTLQNLDPTNSDYYQERLANYLAQLDNLENELRQALNGLPIDQRKLVTAHDAFGYFGSSFDFDVVGIQGISTATEAGVKDVQRITNYIVDNKIKAVFVESSVPRRTIEALQQAVRAKKHEVIIGGMLYSDALGSPNTAEDNYIGMMRYNMKTIINGLK